MHEGKAAIWPNKRPMSDILPEVHSLNTKFRSSDFTILFHKNLENALFAAEKFPAFLASKNIVA